MNNKKASDDEIEASLREILGRMEFPRIVHIADLVQRYVRRKFHGEMDWKRIGILTFIIGGKGTRQPGELARLMVRSSYGITKLIDSLEKDGLLIREASGTDRRAINVYATKAGLAYMKQVMDSTEVAEREVMSYLDEKEREMLKHLIRKLRQGLVANTAKQ